MGKALLTSICLLLALLVLLSGCCRFVNPNLPLNTSSPYRNGTGPSVAPNTTLPPYVPPDNIVTPNRTPNLPPVFIQNPDNTTPAVQGGEFNSSDQNFAAAGNEGRIANASDGQNAGAGADNFPPDLNSVQGQNGSSIHDDAYWQKQIGFGMTRAQWAEGMAEDDFSNSICNALPPNATRIANFPSAAILIPGHLSYDLAQRGDNFTYVDLDAFVGSPLDSRSPAVRNQSVLNDSLDRYYWNCWANMGDIHLCIIPFSVTLNASYGLVQKTGAIKLSFTGPLVPMKSACNWTPPAISSSSSSMCTTGGAPCTTNTNSALPNTPECTNPPSGAGGEGGPSSVNPNWNSGMTLADQPRPDPTPGPRVNTPTFTRTGCEVAFDPTCSAPDEGDKLCGQCSYSSTQLAITIDQWHTNPSGAVNNLGSCHYCPAQDRCSGDNYGICGKVACYGPPAPVAKPPYYVNCGQCHSGYVDNWEGYDSEICLYHLQVCKAYGCQRIPWKCQ